MATEVLALKRNFESYDRVRYWNLFRELAMYAYMIQERIEDVDDRVRSIDEYLKDRVKIFHQFRQYSLQGSSRQEQLYQIIFDESLWLPTKPETYRNLFMYGISLMLNNPLSSIGYDPMMQRTFDPFNVQFQLES